MENIAFTAPHHAASEAGIAVLRQGGNAVDAMIAAATTIAVVYPHMNSWGGDGFWLIQRKGEKPVAIDACGYSASKATPQWFDSLGLNSIPERGGQAAINLAGTVSGWALAREYIGEFHTLSPLEKVFESAKRLAINGFTVTDSLEAASVKTFGALSTNTDFAERFLRDGKALEAGQSLHLPGLAKLLDELAEQGLDSFYRGDIANTLAEGLAAAGSPIALGDLNNFKAQWVEPLTVSQSKAHLYNLPAPTQGIASLIILALYDRVYQEGWSELEKTHHLIECIKQAFIIRNQYVTDPSRLSPEWESLLSDESLDALAEKVQADQALPWPHTAKPGDTVWMGATDHEGTMVSFIQSVYWEFGSGVVIPEYDLVWNNRGISFSLDPNSNNYLQVGMKPFHTLNPAFAELHDGRRLTYGTMGGEGQPQTQAAMFSRFVYEQQSLNDAIAKGRWLLGRTWGDASHNLKLEADLAAELQQGLSDLGHDIQCVDACNELMGHAGAICLSPNGDIDAATDPRSDGAALIERYIGV